MSMTDPIADMLTRIRNAIQAGHRKVEMPASNTKKALAHLLEAQGYVTQVDEIAEGPQGTVTYGDIFHQNEVENSRYNFEEADTEQLFRRFDEAELQCNRLIEKQLALPAYDFVLDASHTFNLLDARKAISVSERQRYILRVRSLARAVAQVYMEGREALGFPLLDAGANAEMAAERAS